MPRPPATAYEVRQLGDPDARGRQRNVGVVDLENLTSHHPGANRYARLEDGIPVNAENAIRRSYGVVGGEFQELQTVRTDWSYHTLAPDQVLIIKDFILDDMSAANTRRVEVPSPSAGVVGRVDTRNGVVDILEPASERLIVRVRHLGPIAVAVGDTVAYGQSLGTQNNVGLPATAGKHVHLEMDTREYQQLDHYIRDLVDGRLPVQAAHRFGVLPSAVVDDGVQRVGESGERVAMVQRALVLSGYRAVGGAAIEVDGVYRLSMQGAVLAFQLDNGLAQSGDIDARTWRAALDVALGKPILPPAFDGDWPAPLLPRRGGLLEQIRGHVGALDAARGPGSDADSERMVHALLRLASEEQLQSVDHVLLSAPTAGRPSAAEVFLVQGSLVDPVHRRVSMATCEAVATPVEDSLARVRALDRLQATAAAPQVHPVYPVHPAHPAHLPSS